MKAKLVFPNSTFTLHENVWPKSLLLRNLADDKYLDEPIVYPYEINEITINCFMDYLIKDEISENWDKCDFRQIFKFVEFFQFTNANDFYHIYYQNIDDGSLSKIQTILRCQRMTHDNSLRPLPSQLYKKTITFKIDNKVFMYDTAVPIDQPAPIITLCPLNRIIRIPPSSYDENLDWTPDVDICGGEIDLNQNFWLRDLPWSGVGISGGFIVSSLTGTLTEDQDIDLYVLDFNILDNLIKHFVREVPDLKIYAPNTYKDRFSILTLRSEGQRPLQIICSGHKTMSAVVRTFDLSHLKIWLDENGLHAEVTTFKELLLGYSQIYRPSNKTPERIEKYIQRRWFIFGNDKFITTIRPRHPNVELTLIDPNTCLQYCQESKKTMMGYINQIGIHLGDIKNLNLSDIQQLRLVKLGQTEHLHLFTPIFLLIPITKLLVFSNKHQYTPAKVVTTLNHDIADQINILRDHLFTCLNLHKPVLPLVMNNVLKCTLDDSLLPFFPLYRMPTIVDKPLTIEIEFYGLSPKFEAYPRLINIF